MKKNWITVLNSKQVVSLLFFLCVLADAKAATTKINGVTYDTNAASATNASTPASKESSRNEVQNSQDNLIRVKKIFLFPAVDDVNGVLAPKLDQKLIELFNKNTRFDLVRDKDVIKALSPDDQGYIKAAENKEVHKEAARLSGADSTAILKTRNVGNNAEMNLEIRDAQGEPLFLEGASVPGYSSMEVRSNAVEKMFQSFVKKIPFQGSVTGRSAKMITLDLGIGNILQGAEVTLARVVSIQRHPLFQTVVGTDYVRVGKAKVISVDRLMSFAEIIEEFPGESVNPGNKIIAAGAGVPIVLGEEKQASKRPEPIKKYEDPFEDRLKGDFDNTKARFGRAGINLAYGSISHSQTMNGTSEYSGSGIGGSIDGEVWITKNWIAQLYYGSQGAELSGANGAVAGSSTWNRIELAAGYRFFPEGLGEKTAISASLGYQVIKINIPPDQAGTLSGKRYAGVLVRVDGGIEVFPKHRFSAGVGIQPLSSFTDSAQTTLGTPDSATVIIFMAGWDYSFADNFFLRLGAQFDTANGSYKNDASISEKRFAIGPGIYYSF